MKFRSNTKVKSHKLLFSIIVFATTIIPVRILCSLSSCNNHINGHSGKTIKTQLREVSPKVRVYTYIKFLSKLSNPAQKNKIVLANKNQDIQL